jgi:hypothetical protein
MDVGIAVPVDASDPEFPPQFHTAIQATIRDRGYSFVLYESYDYKCNAVVQEYYKGALGHVRLLFDFGHRQLWRMHAPNETYPKGVCIVQPIVAEVPFERISGTHVASTQHFLGARNASWKHLSRTTTKNQLVRCAALRPRSKSNTAPTKLLERAALPVGPSCCCACCSLCTACQRQAGDSCSSLNF